MAELYTPTGPADTHAGQRVASEAAQDRVPKRSWRRSRTAG